MCYNQNCTPGMCLFIMVSQTNYLCIRHKEWQEFTDPSGKLQQKFGNVYYHEYWHDNTHFQIFAEVFHMDLQTPVIPCVRYTNPLVDSQFRIPLSAPSAHTYVSYNKIERLELNNHNGQVVAVLEEVELLKCLILANVLRQLQLVMYYFHLLYEYMRHSLPVNETRVLVLKQMTQQVHKRNEMMNHLNLHLLLLHLFHCSSHLCCEVQSVLCCHQVHCLL